MLDPRFQALRLLARHNTVTAAARASNYTPSAVSAQLRSLAQDVGAPLLEHRGRGVRLTETGRLVLEHADEVAAGWEELLARVHAEGGRPAEHVTLSGFSTAAAGLLPRAAREVMREHPGTTVRIIEADPGDCFDLLLGGEADVAVVVAIGEIPMLRDPRFTQQRLGEDPLDLLVPADHPLSRRESIMLVEAAAEEWIMDRPGRPYQRLVAGACLAAGFTPEVAHEVVEWETGAALVHAGLGVALVPQLANLPAVYDIVRVPLSGNPRPARVLRTAVRKGAQGQPRIATALRAVTAELRRREVTGSTDVAGPR